ncbi:OSB1, mitochondrial-like protein [Tanacetum coccineum]|uniref:OSB1, mitochondrial-like protein n=1 Tax=Tanacetum coccineum TaxID=301880 RepID=A0ABQ5EBX5_9ASTR
MAATVTRLLRPLLSSHQYKYYSSSISDLQIYRNRHLTPDDPQPPTTTGSLIYQNTLKTQRPNTIRRHKALENSVRLIGTVDSDVKSNNNDGILWAYTYLKVESPSKSNKFITVLLNMWDDMAELSTQHLKHNDYIYVSGYIRFYRKASDYGNIILKHKVIVKELNFVANNGTKNEIIEDQEVSFLEKQRERLHLWQVFFASPYEWRDLRKCKVNPRQPDFKHKSTGEALWLSSRDPPWVTRQLELQDSRMGDMGFREHLNSGSSLSPLSYNDS